MFGTVIYHVHWVLLGYWSGKFGEERRPELAEKVPPHSVKGTICVVVVSKKKKQVSSRNF